MTDRWTWVLVGIALGAGLALRFGRLDARPMHHDEANQAVKFGALLERGEYRYDAHDHHGPTLYYLSLPAAWLRGQGTLASLDEVTLRGVTAVFGAATILLLPLMAAGTGRTAVASGAILLALSPAMVFYSRMFIQESLFACFTLAFVLAVGRATTSGGLVWFTVAGVAAGLAIATKETSVILLPAAIVASAISWWSLGERRHKTSPPDRRWRMAVLVSLVVAASIAALFYTSFLTFPAGLIQPFLGAGIYLGRGMDPARHAHPWYYYLSLLTYSSSGGLRWSEALVVVLAIAGAVTAWVWPDSRPDRAFWARYLACHVVITTAIFSAIRYKTPWNLLPFYAAMIALAGIGFSTLVHAISSRIIRGVMIAAFVLAAANLGWQAWRASVTYSADPRNPYVYAQTVPDAVRMASRIRALASVHPDKANMQVSVIAQPYEQWPLPWYLRAMPYVGYWTVADDALALRAPVIVASMEYTTALDAALGDRYVSEFHGLRPEVVLALYVERGLWDRYMASGLSLLDCDGAPHAAASDTSDGPALPGVMQSAAQHCGQPPAVALWRATNAP